MKSFSIRIRAGKEGVFAECSHLDIFANGSTLRNALLDFWEQYTYFSKYYAAFPHDELTGLATELKKRFAEIEEAIG